MVTDSITITILVILLCYITPIPIKNPFVTSKSTNLKNLILKNKYKSEVFFFFLDTIASSLKIFFCLNASHFSVLENNIEMKNKCEWERILDSFSYFMELKMLHFYFLQTLKALDS